MRSADRAHRRVPLPVTWTIRRTLGDTCGAGRVIGPHAKDLPPVAGERTSGSWPGSLSRGMAAPALCVLGHGATEPVARAPVDLGRRAGPAMSASAAVAAHGPGAGHVGVAWVAACAAGRAAPTLSVSEESTPCRRGILGENPKRENPKRVREADAVRRGLLGENEERPMPPPVAVSGATSPRPTCLPPRTRRRRPTPGSGRPRSRTSPRWSARRCRRCTPAAVRSSAGSPRPLCSPGS